VENWNDLISSESQKPYWKTLHNFIKAERKNTNVLPESKNIFRALDLTELNRVKAVILGQDPYHGTGQANGLAFSVHRDQKIPPSLRNIFQELDADLGIKPADHGDLTKWADQGVLLLNTTLTVTEKNPGSHANKGWEIFTNKIIETINTKSETRIFILWGNHAKNKIKLISNPAHRIISSPHPSPLSSYRGFFGSKPFSKTNAFLKASSNKPIDWQLD